MALPATGLFTWLSGVFIMQIISKLYATFSPERGCEPRTQDPLRVLQGVALRQALGCSHVVAVSPGTVVPKPAVPGRIIRRLEHDPHQHVDLHAAEGRLHHGFVVASVAVFRSNGVTTSTGRVLAGTSPLRGERWAYRPVDREIRRRPPPPRKACLPDLRARECQAGVDTPRVPPPYAT